MPLFMVAPLQVIKTPGTLGEMRAHTSLIASSLGKQIVRSTFRIVKTLYLIILDLFGFGTALVVLMSTAISTNACSKLV